MSRYYAISEIGYGVGSTEVEAVQNYYTHEGSAETRATILKAPEEASGFVIVAGIIRWQIGKSIRMATDEEVVGYV